MSEREEYTPDLGSIRSWYAGAVNEYWCDTGMSEEDGEMAFDRAIAAHDKALRRKWVQEATEDAIAHDEALEKALREQIALDIEQHYLGPDFDRNPATGADSPHAAEHRAFDEGLEAAALIVREEGQ